MLDIQGLSKKYGDYLAVDHVSFTVPTGKIGILLGPNGAGKSTIIKSIAGLLRYEGGIGIQKMEAHSMEAKKIFAYVPELPAMFDALTVREHIEYVRKAYDSNITDQEVEAILTRFELEDKQDKLGNELSKGMMQKVSICCALCIKPQVILLDEPMVGLDPSAAFQLKQIMKELCAQGSTIFFSTHVLEVAEKLCDKIAIIKEGRLVVSGPTHEVIGQSSLEDVFLELIDHE